MKISEAKKKYGPKMWKKMNASGWLTGITVTMTDGEPDIPEHDLKIAHKAATGKPIHPLEWD
jgi:hypothetical protein